MSSTAPIWEKTSRERGREESLPSWRREFGWNLQPLLPEPSAEGHHCPEKKRGFRETPPPISPSPISRLLPSSGPSDLQSPFFRSSPHPLPSHSPIGTSRPFASKCRLQPALGLPEPCSLPAHLLHNADDASDEGVRVLVLLSTGVQIHATFLKHHLGTEPVRGGTQTQEDTRGRGPQALPGRPRGGAKR